MKGPERIVCLSGEAADILFELGCADRVAGVTGFAPKPPDGRRIPRVSGFSQVHFDRVDALQPDLVITFSDVQAAAAQELIKRGHRVLATNQRSLAEIFATIILLGRVVGKERAGLALANGLRKEILGRRIRAAAKPKVYFEEWNDPFISGIRWVSELIEAAGGEDVFGELRDAPRAADRVVTAAEIIRRRPDIIIASWCGKKANLAAIRARPGWEEIPAVRTGKVYEIPSGVILQPGPVLREGFRQLRTIIGDWAGR